MKLLNLISLRNTGITCEKCVHFQNNPAVIEKLYPGLKTMSSGYASVRYQDGICDHHQIYLSVNDSCAGFTPVK